jgi:murein DD-endopeptidase MepM/ murein hydrolase activator NlpD
MKFNIEPVRPGAGMTTLFGHDIDPIEKVYRFHRAIDRSGGDGAVYCPLTARRAIIENPSVESFGTLIRLIYDGFEIRLAHCKNFDPIFTGLVKAEQPIIAGLCLAQEGTIGKSTGPHTHIELVAIGKRHPDLDAALIEHGGDPGASFRGSELTGIGDYREWMGRFGVTRIGPQECFGWDYRTNSNAYWMDPQLVLGL